MAELAGAKNEAVGEKSIFAKQKEAFLAQGFHDLVSQTG